MFHGAEKESTFRRVNSSLAQENAAPPAGKNAALLRWLPTLLIIAAALAYYGSYLRYWFNPHDEGGTVCLIAQRLMQGERPWLDVALGYNVGWFYPLVGLFHLTGVNYLAARAFFFALSTLPALLGCGIVRRVGGPRWLGVAVGLVLVVLPGSQFKNYIPLAGMANTACLIHLLTTDPAARRKWLTAIALGGAVLGLTALVRVEIAIFFAVIWALLLLLVLLDKRLAFPQRAVNWVLGGVLLTTVVCAVQVPPYFYLRSLGVESYFTDQVPAWLHGLQDGVSDQIGAPEKPAPAPVATAENAAVKTSPPVPDRTTLRRHALSGIWHPRTYAGLPGDRWDRVLAFLTHAPLAGFGLFFLGGVFGCARRVVRGDFKLNEHSMKWLLLIGGSLATFPQFFFFRPDRPHLSEFMPGYILAMTACVSLLWPRGEKRTRPRILLASAFAACFLAHLAVFALFAFQHPSAGTAAARTGRKTKFAAENGVAVHASKKEAASLTIVRDTILAHSRPGDFLVCYPYNPGYNLMTNRRTYVHNVYIDNATHEPGWAAQTIRDFEEKKPAVIVIDNRAINGSAASRFSHWAAPVYDYVRIHYARVAEIKPEPKTDPKTGLEITSPDFIQIYAQSFDPIAP